MFEYTRYLAFHKELAEKHPKLSHIDGERIAWLGDEDAEDARGERKQAPFLMMMLQPTGSIRGDEDSAVDVWRGGFELVGRKKNSGDVDFRKDELLAQEAFAIGRQIIDRINTISNGEACEDDDCRCVIGAFELSGVRWSKINYKATHVGWRFTYAIGDGQINEYDETIW